MPGSTAAIVLGSWVLLAILSVLAYRFNTRQADED
jgi:hypothetical protein